MSVESVMPSNHLILCRPFFFLPSVFTSIRVFSSEWILFIRWPKYWSFSFSISPSNEFSGLISFRIDWLDLLTVQGALKSLLQNNQFFSTQPSLWSTSHITHDYWESHIIDYMYFYLQVTPLLFNMLSRFIIHFPPRSKCLLISWLQSLSAVILEPRKIKSVTASTFFPIYLP